ncbi:MAG: asparagine synthase (glutamine-hydrolyzing) [Ardenticatenaceae bacterium]|nr:asparagine synthase (glutamine-hydrolyzing) [Ardenticatenaceae bacterium]
MFILALHSANLIATHALELGTNKRMCGIAGLLTFNSPQNCIHSLTAMTNAQRHRGPDGGGIELVNKQYPTIGFGHRRLAIIDLSEAGYQPMLDVDTGNWLTFNGEIYNYRMLRQRLLSLGQTFQSKTDSEVILKAYAQWGDDFVEFLEGMFAFAIWDVSRQRLILARDPLGIKPLYYWAVQQDIMFASEVRAMLASGLVDRRLSHSALYSYLLYGSVQEPNTLVQGVQSLPPGNILVWEQGQTKMHSYWQLPMPQGDTMLTKPALWDETREYLEHAVSTQLVSDVPLGAFLSGGIDSTAIVALMRKKTELVKTFSVVFSEDAYDERAYARIAARHIGTAHTELPLTGQIVREELPNALSAFDQPSMDGINTYFVSKVTREAGITVALSGVGGDELFGGYSGYAKSLLLEKWGSLLQRLPAPIRAFSAGMLTRFPQRELARRGAELFLSKRHPYFLTRQVFSQQQISQLLEPMFKDELGCWSDRLYRLERETAVYDPINRAAALELQTYMLSTLLRDTDQMSMAHALEVRVPLIDQQLVQYLFTLPGHYKLENHYPKPLLTHPLKDLLPEKCVFRPKQGFTLPFETWLRQGLQDEIKAQFTGATNQIIMPFQAKALANLWISFEMQQISWSRIWSIYTLSHWLREHQIEL